MFERVLDEVGPTLARLDFFNYGEAFLHKKAVEMCELVKSRYPHVYLYTSTNGGAFTEDRVRQLVRSGIDEMTFSLDGASQDVYVRYRQRGSFDKSTHDAAPRRERASKHVPASTGYTFNERQRSREGAGARLEPRVGVDRCSEINRITSKPTGGCAAGGARGDPQRIGDAQQPRQRGPRALRARIEVRGAPDDAKLP